MKIYRPTALRAFLAERGLDPKKGLSQNFLIDGNIIQKIVQTAHISAGDRVLEVGPGPGALTEALLNVGAHVHAVEMDTQFADALHRLQTKDSRLHVYPQDILDFPLLDFLRAGKKCKVVANLPYHITTPILTRLLPLHPFIETLTLMVQKEFADRLQGEKRTPEYSSLTLFLQCYAAVEECFCVSPQCFYPRPTVHSSVIHCRLHPPPFEQDIDSFFQLTRTAFGQRRKMLRSSLKDLYGSAIIEKVLLSAGHPITARPEELSLNDFIFLFGACANNKNPELRSAPPRKP